MGKICAGGRGETFRGTSDNRPYVSYNSNLLPLLSLESYVKDATDAISNGKGKSVPTALLDFWEAVALSIIAHEIDSMLSLEDRVQWRKALEPLWSKVAAGMFSLLQTQCLELIHGLISVISPIVTQKSMGTVLLPKIPLGNYLPTLIAEEIYQNAGWTVVSPVWNLPRHDVYRDAAILRMLADYASDSFFTLHYFDEWETGRNIAGITESILRADWPVAKLAVSAIGNSTNLMLNADSSDWKAFAAKFEGLKPKSIQLTPSSLQPVETQLRKVFYADAARLIGFRKMNFANQLASEMVDLALKVIKDIPKSIADFRASSLQKLSGNPIPDSVVMEGLTVDAEFLKDGGKRAQREIESLYMESFPTAPYYLDEWEDFLIGSLHRQEQNFLTKALGHVIPCSTILVSTLLLPKMARVINSYYLPPMRSNSKLPYHLLRLRGTLDGIPHAFRELLREETRKVLRQKKL